MPYIGNSPKNNVRSRFYYTATAAQTLFSGADSNGKTLAYQDGGYVDVYLNGVLLQDTTDYTAATKTSVTLTSGATAGDLVEIIAYGIFSVGDTVSAANGGTFKGNVTIDADLTVDTNTLHVDSANNRVGIGTASPATLLDVRDGVGSILTLGNSGTFTAGESSYLKFREASTQLAEIGWEADTNELRINNRVSLTSFYTTNTERARIDSSGNLLVHKTSPDQAVEGMEFAAANYLLCTKSGGTTAYFNRTTSDGPIAEYRKDGSSIGSIGNSGSYMYLASLGPSARGVKITDNFIPATTTGVNNDNVMDLGGASVRWDDVYATNGTIQTSDANLKTSIASLTDAEITAAKAISKLFKTFKWNDKVEAKGDAARTHAGVIAQDVQQAMIDAGLDAGNYAFFISSTWWEADETYTDDDGVEQTRTNSYATAEEAPDNAVERTRLGIRYPELLAFIGAATEQRLTSIEARLDALETP